MGDLEVPGAEEDEVVVGVAVGCHITQVTEEPNLERASNSGTAR